MTRTPEDIADLFAFGRWATRQTLASAAPLTPEEFARPIGGSFGSVEATLTHLYGADWVWLERWHGRSPRALAESDAAPNLAALARMWETVHDGQQAFVASLSSTRMSELLTYVNFAGKTLTYGIGDTLVHAANHATYHRGQIATLLRQLGKTPISTDYLRYIDTLPK
jgi:uncharacterized damage-inducible protein DinB